MSQEHGSFQNTILGSSEPVPVVGMGATEYKWTDRCAYTIVRVSESGKTFWMQEDKAERVDANGMSEAQSYEFTPDPTAPLVEVRINKRLGWKIVGGGGRVGIGHRSAYYDYSF
jgi:hypothetical protein